jgi:hypothetical protein
MPEITSVFNALGRFLKNECKKIHGKEKAHPDEGAGFFVIWS